MPALSQYTNVESTAVAVLRTKGFQVWEDREAELIWAEKDGWDFAADSACALLGVVAIYEAVRPATYEQYWWRLREGGTVLPAGPRPYRSVIERD